MSDFCLENLHQMWYNRCNYSLTQKYMMNYGYGYGDMIGFHFFGTLLTVLFWVLLIVLIVRLMKGGRHGDWMHGHHPFMGKSPLDVLKERYAKGEIDKKEFEEKKKDLME